MNNPAAQMGHVGGPGKKIYKREGETKKGDSIF